jgi:hypothetical protein
MIARPKDWYSMAALMNSDTNLVSYTRCDQVLGEAQLAEFVEMFASSTWVCNVSNLISKEKADRSTMDKGG